MTLDAQDHECTLAELSDAMRTGYRESVDGTFYIRRCPLRWFRPHEVCDLLQRRDVYALLAGDSLVRHVANGAFMAATGNIERGCVSYWDLPDERRRGCSCATAFEDHSTLACREHHIAYFRGDSKMVCGGWDVMRILFDDWHANLDDYRMREYINAIVAARATGVYYFHQALHHQMEPAVVLPQLQLVADVLRNESAEHSVRLPLIFATSHATDEAKKPREWVATQNNARAAALNERVRALAARVGAVVFETFAFTMNATSYDGTHYDHRVNVPLGQVYMNYLEALTRPDGEAPPPLF